MKLVAIVSLLLVIITNCLANDNTKVTLRPYQNPLSDKQFYVNPTFQENVDRAIDTASLELDADKVIKNLQVARNTPSAYWLDVMRKVDVNCTSLDSMNGILLDASKQNPPPMPIFIIYNLPNRDCSARASAGEICCTVGANQKCDLAAPGDCKQGLDTYKNSYINNIVTIMNKFKDQVPMAFIIEPDSLGNIVTNSDKPTCGQATQASYKEGIKLAVDAISSNASNFPIYIDLAHGGWLGSQKNTERAVELIKSMNILDKIRGFATNISNYMPLGEACPEALFCLPDRNQTGNACCADPCGLNKQSNPANSELNYAQSLAKLMPDKFFVIDTSRNGVPNARTSCGNWCNPRNTGLGRLPTADTPLPIVDGLLWLKTPGETDGCTEELPNGEKCPRFDDSCASPDSIGTKEGEPRMPEAGTFSDFQMIMLARNANFGI